MPSPKDHRLYSEQTTSPPPQALVMMPAEDRASSVLRQLESEGFNNSVAKRKQQQAGSPGAQGFSERAKTLRNNTF